MVVRSVAVLGAGVMGAQIAAHFANAGVPALLLDVTADAARDGLKRARSLKPDPFFTSDTAKLISTGSFDELARIQESDWIIEAIVEQLDIKRSLLEKVDAARRQGSIVSSNTSGIPISALAEGRSVDFRRHWLGTHFFNPPRYLHLLEVIPTAETAKDVVEAVSSFADRHLGKGVVIAKDSPNFIGNHIALYGVVQILKQVESGAFTIEEVDAITGPALGRPKSATFRTLDLAGIDILAHVVHNLYERLPDEAARREFVLPTFVEKMVERKMVGEKAGQGFYKRVRTPDGGSEILTLDPTTLEYRPRKSPKLGSLEAAAPITDVRERIRTLYNGKDRVGEFLRATLMPTLEYTRKVAPEIAYSPDDVDRVMRWGFGWELGPFELLDAIEGKLREVASAAPDLQLLKSAKDRSRVVKKNAGASLVDLGGGVLCVEFHSKMNAIGGDTIQMLHAGLKEASANFQALVVGNEGEHFSAGANIMLLLLEAQEENWDEVDLMVRAFQGATMALRYAGVPVIVAPAGLALGGGCEITMHADRVQAAAESYVGLVEVGVGLIPAGGGTKEMVARAAESMPPGSTDFLPSIQRAFETVGFGKVSASAPDAQRLGYLRAVDAWTMNRDRLIADAKATALRRVAEGYQPPAPRTTIPVGGDAVLAPLKLGIHLAWRAGRISDHDALIGRKLATIMAGGSLPHPSTVTEQQLLDLEREAFLGLVAERKTQERIQHTLKTGKPLRN
ncbi:MAG TPA: 3-hydroxyacyl-CoA dehydrogenase NAD-binding domain-containing protein [Vicinamibacterales bacterium]|jgi:3-hydroxyacyl-CoA dehydrogenase|nr:3-hydroxyacyl-CoA dehydrogenase NAD-binding domain-containing protein [Vicinamibacterales bacterium]